MVQDPEMADRVKERAGDPLVPEPQGQVQLQAPEQGTVRVVREQ